MCYFTYQQQPKKIPFISILTLFLFLVTSKMAIIIGGVTGLQLRLHP